MPGIGLQVVSAPRDGVALLKFIVDVAQGRGGKIVDELIAADAKLAKMEADANARLAEREAELALMKKANDEAMQARVNEANAQVEEAKNKVAALHAELNEAVVKEQARLDKEDRLLQEKAADLVERAREVSADAEAAADLMARAQNLYNEGAKLKDKYEAWLVKVEGAKV